jgi:AraC-like DNA-binding protein
MASLATLAARYQEHPSPVDLQDWVQCLWTMEAPVAMPWTHRVLPDGCIDILFDVSGGCTGQSYVVGMMTRPLLVARSGPSHTTAVRFKPGGAVAFFREPLHRLTDARVELQELWARPGPMLERLAAAAPRQRVDLLVAELRRRLAERLPRGLAGCRIALHRLAQEPETGVRDLCAEVGVSRQALARSFRDHVGVPPKTLARVLRLQRALSLLAQPEAGRTLPWAELAVAAGFYDQSHLIAEWRELVGLTPREYLAESRGRFPFFQDGGAPPA